MKFQVEKIKIGSDTLVLKITPQGMLSPGDVVELVDKAVKAVELEKPKTVVLSGRLPIWSYTSLCAYLIRQGISVATADPKLGSAVGPAGEVIPLPPEAF